MELSKILALALLLMQITCTEDSEEPTQDVGTYVPVDFAVAYCPCDQTCYTNEVSNLACDDRSASFDSYGLPDSSHTLMVGITATNQQLPFKQDATAAANNQIRIPLNPSIAATATLTEAGAIGIAVNGVPIFDPRTQAGDHAPHTLEIGELDDCGGHAGRGDDYHYHVAPNCLIAELGETRIEIDRVPIAYARDGFSVHAIGWFNETSIEGNLDGCRGTEDSTGQYFYNVQREANFDMLNCYRGTPQNTGPHGESKRYNKNGEAMSGAIGFEGLVPMKFSINAYTYDANNCHIASGTFGGESVILANGTANSEYSGSGGLFYCNEGCYSYFYEPNKSQAPRVIQNDYTTSSCPESFDPGQYYFQ